MAFSGERMIMRKDGAIGWMTLNNPEKRNSFTEDMLLDMAHILEDFEADPAIRCVVMRGAGGKAFCAGADLKSQARHLDGPEAVRSYADAGQKATAAQANFKKPLIAMIEGFCIGGGLAFAMRADIRIANDVSRFGIPAAKLSFAYPFEAIQNLTQLVGSGHAKAILFGGRQMDSAEALRIGLVDFVVPAAELEDYVREFTSEIAANAPLSIAYSKMCVDMVTQNKVDIAKLREVAAATQGSADCAEGIRANREKRTPAFIGR